MTFFNSPSARRLAPCGQRQNRSQALWTERASRRLGNRGFPTIHRAYYHYSYESKIPRD